LIKISCYVPFKNLSAYIISVALFFYNPNILWFDRYHTGPLKGKKRGCNNAVNLRKTLILSGFKAKTDML